jgi:Spy/CpxP family protein refolding chaperone
MIFCVESSAMDREMIVEHLALAEQHVKEGEAIIERQRDLIARLTADGHDTAKANALLAQFIDTLRAQNEDRDRLQRELAEHDAQEVEK